MASTHTGRLVHLNSLRQVELHDVGHTDHDTYVVTESDDGTVVFTPASNSDDTDLALLARPDMMELLERDSSECVEMSIEPTAENAAMRLAHVALRQAGYWGPPDFDVDVAHPRFRQAVEAAAAAPDKQQAIEAARSILEGPEALAVYGLAP